MNEPEPVLVGVDFTSETLRLMLGSLTGKVHYRQDFALPPLEDEEAWAWEVGGRISTAFAAEGQRRWALGIGVACPGIVDSAAGVLLECMDVPAWDGLHVVDSLRRHIDAPVVAIGRVEAALRGEASSGAAANVFDALYVSLEDGPASAILSSGRVIGGVRGRAGSLPAFPTLTAGTTLAGDDMEQAAALLADAVVLLDTAALVIHGLPEHAEPLIGVMRGVMEELSPETDVIAGALGQYAALLGALQAASIVAYEGDRDDDES